MKASVLLTGPQGSGKTLIAPLLAKHLGLTHICEIDQLHNLPISERRHILSSGAVLVGFDESDPLLRSFSFRRIDINDAMQMLGVRSLAELKQRTRNATSRHLS